MCFDVVVHNLKQFERKRMMTFHWIPLLLVTRWIYLPVVSTKNSGYELILIARYWSKNFCLSGVRTFNIAFFTLKCLLERLVIQCSCRAKSGRSLFFEEKMRTWNTQNIKINMTCGSDFRLKKLYLFLYIFNIFARKLKIRYQFPDDEKCMEPP